MLDSFIIEELKRREREAFERAEQERPRLEIPIYTPMPKAPRKKDERASGGNVIHIDILGGD